MNLEAFQYVLTQEYFLFFFLCVRLAEERQAAAEQHLKHSAAEDKRQKMLDSLREAGVENFTMRAAVPGTEVPGHKVSRDEPRSGTHRYLLQMLSDQC